MNAEQWNKIRDCCRDEAAFEQLLQILTTTALPTRLAPTPNNPLLAQQALTAAISRIRAPQDLESLLTTAVTEARQLFQADRVCIFRFNPETQWRAGTFIAEDVHPSFIKIFSETAHARCFHTSDSQIEQAHQASLDLEGLQQESTASAIADIYDANLEPCDIERLTQLQVRACLTAPVLRGETLWGWLCIQQCQTPRQWQTSEINFATQIASHLGIALQQDEILQELRSHSQQLTKIAEREQSIILIIGKLGRALLSRVSQNSDPEETLNETLEEVRSFLKADRVVVYRFNPDWSGEFIAEATTAQGTRLLEQQHDNPALQQNISNCSLKLLPGDRFNDTYFQQNQGKGIHPSTSFVVSDIDKTHFSSCYRNMLQLYQVRAYAIVPIFQNTKLWGLLAAYQNLAPRQWETSEVSLLAQVADQVGSALQLANSMQESQLQAASKRIITNIANQIRQSLEISTVLNTTTKEALQLLQVERIAIYQFHPDWSGEFVAEAVTTGWTKLVGANIRTIWEDTELQSTQGGRYRNNETRAVHDIYTVEHAQCHLDILEQFQIKAYAIAPIFSGGTLWGLIAAYQHSQPHLWQDEDMTLLTEIGTQLGIALQQAALFTNLRTEIAEREQAEQAVKMLNQNLQQSVCELQSVNRELEAFSYSVSHDLRAPLRSIDGFSQALLEDYSDRLDEMGQDYLNRVRKATQKMGQLIDDLLMLSRVTRSEMRHETVNLSEIVRAIAAELQQLHPHRQVNLEIQDGLVVSGDPHLLKILLTNLLDNAWKFTSKKDIARVKFSTLHQNHDPKTYYVQDNGAGFDMAYASKLFGAFQRLHPTREFPGTGIGLATIQRIVHRHGGQAWAESATDQGATFYFTLG